MTQETPPQPHLRLDFYPTTVILSRRARDGRVTVTPVSVHDVVAACTGVAVGSGLLPPDALFWQRRADATEMGIYVPAGRRRVLVGDGDETVPIRLPWPPLVFAGRGATYRVFAVTERPADAQARLYHAPCPNVHRDGTVCPGNTPFPACAAGTIGRALALFLEGSAFNGDLAAGKCRRHPDDVRDLWRDLDGEGRFPPDELVPASLTLAALLAS